MARVAPILVKLGGSVLSFKDRPLSPNLEAMDELSRCIASCSLPVVIVHGGGSFGHYYAKLHGLSTRPSMASAEAVSKTRGAMLELNLMLVQSLSKFGVQAYSIPPSDFTDGKELTSSETLSFSLLLRRGLTPVTFGDVVPSRQGFFVLSGDVIMRLLAEALHPLRAVFAMDVDGIYPFPEKRDKVLLELDARQNIRTSMVRSFDVTGGIALKLREAFRIARSGTDIYFVNGLRAERFLKALKGEDVYSTKIRGLKDGG